MKLPARSSRTAGASTSGRPVSAARPLNGRAQRRRGEHVPHAGRDVARRAAAEVAEKPASDGPPPPRSAASQTLEQYEMASAPGKQRAGASSVNSGIKLDKIVKTFKDNELLRGVSWDCKRGDRVGLVGVNGAGKTTQLQIVMGNLEPDSGEVVKSKPNLHIAYLNQEFDINPERTVREELSAAYEEGMAVVARTEEIQKELEAVTDDMDKMSALLDELNKLSNKAVDLDMSTLDKKIDQMMPELGFREEDNDRLVKEYSGGWQMRMCLGKILLQDPDVLLLDEPTNHLDLDAIQWLEGYVQNLQIPTVIVSHDREFLDQVCNKIVETERGVATTYRGNYSQFLRQKAEATAQQFVAHEKWSREVAKQRDIMRRLSGGAQSGRAASAEKALARLNQDKVSKPFEERRRTFRFPPVESVGERVATIKNLTHGYNGRPLFVDQSLEITRGDRIAIIGPNGAGKSTLLRLIMGREAAQEGHVFLGEHSIVPNFYEQNQSEALDPKLTVLDTLMLAAADTREDEVKALLGRMMFKRSAFEKKVGVLSGGEKARLALAKFMLTKGTLLVLDEPTNHLDIPSKEMLEEAVCAFEGAVIAVSHDRYFLRKIANRVVTVEGQSLVDYGGDYDHYLRENGQEAQKMAVKAERTKKLMASTVKSKSKMSKAEKKASKKLKAREFEMLGKKK